jgi:hypothetical protein
MTHTLDPAVVERAAEAMAPIWGLMNLYEGLDDERTVFVPLGMLRRARHMLASAIREAVEGERRAAMKILEDRIDVCFATVDKHNGVGQIALNASAFGAELAELYAAIRARGEEKGK